MAERFDDLKLFWGDAHTNVHGEDPFLGIPKLTRKRLRRIMRAAKEHLDFFPIAYYPFEWYTKNGLANESCGHRDRFTEDWKLVEEAVAEANQPDKFVTFLGYEWHGDRRKYGDHNVYYLDDYGPLDCSETIEGLYKNLERTNGIAVPHHTGYQVGERGKDWDYYDEELSPFVEVYSSHGSSEGCWLPFTLEHNISMGPRVSGGTVLDGLNRGYKLGITASGDNHNDFPGVWGNGLMAVYARRLTRKDLWEAFKKRRVYGVTGDRIQLLFTANGHMMGEVFRSEAPADIDVEVTGSHAIDRIEIIRNGRVMLTYSHSGNWNPPKGKGLVRAKIRIQFSGGPASHYGFKHISSRNLMGSFEISDGEILSVEPCFTYFGQDIKKVSRNTCEFTFTVQPRPSQTAFLAQHHRSNFQGAVFEVESQPESRITIGNGDIAVESTLEDALKKGSVVALRKEAEKLIAEEFGLEPDDVENPDVYWHNAWKMKVHRAIPYEGYHVRFRCTDEGREEENYYYVRITQQNGQMAWSSPIWVKYGR